MKKIKDFIAIFDSGIGGLTVFKTLSEQLKTENFVYLADTANCPYGVKTKEEVRRISLANLNYLKELGAKAIVIACNTATSSVLPEIKNSNGYLIGVIEPTANLAKKVTKNHQIGLIATNLTIQSGVYDNFLGADLVFKEGCSDLVSLIENQMINTKEMHDALNNHLSPSLDIDTLILGCTHFPYVKDQIATILPDVTIVESGKPTFDVLNNYLISKNITSKTLKRKLVFLTTGNLAFTHQQLQAFNYHFDEEYQMVI